jgi:HEAT repeat protein
MIELDRHLTEIVREIQPHRANGWNGLWFGGLRRAGAIFKALRKRGLALAGMSITLASTLGALSAQDLTDSVSPKANDIFDRVRLHDFHPLRDGFTFDRHLDKHGVASLDDQDWLVRTLAVRDLVRLSAPARSALISALGDSDPHVRQVAVMVLGIHQATNSATALAKVLIEDSESVVRSQAAIALGQIGRSASLPVLKSSEQNDMSRDVQHQAALAAYAIEQGIRPTPELATAYAELDETRFNRVKVGQPAPDFQLAEQADDEHACAEGFEILGREAKPEPLARSSQHEHDEQQRRVAAQREEVRDASPAIHTLPVEAMRRWHSA